jgi:hypothetical protein
MSAKKPELNGKPASRHTGPRSPLDVPGPKAQLKKLLAAIYDQYQKLDDPAANKECRLDFVFHMTDWADDLRRLADLYRDPGRFDRSDGGKVVAGFLIHVTAHLMEAARLMLDYEPGYIFDSPKPKTPPAIKPASRRRRPTHSR